MKDGNWPLGLHRRAAARMAAYIGPVLDTQINPLIEQHAEREHKWGLYAVITAIASAAALYKSYEVFGDLAHIFLLCLGGLNIGVLGTMTKKNRALHDIRRQLDGFVSHDLFQLEKTDISLNPRDGQASVLSLFHDAGFLGAYDHVHHLSGYRPARPSSKVPPSPPQDGGPPLMAHCRLTRTEVETYTDSKGRVQRRQRTVEVFHGLFLTLEVPEPPDDSRIILSSRHIRRPRGVFDRFTMAGNKTRRQKLKDIKTSSPSFNRLYEVKGDDQVEAHEFLDPDRIMRFLNLNTDLCEMFDQKKKVEMSMLLTRGHAHFAVRTGPLAAMHAFTGKAEDMRQQIANAAAQLALPHIIAEHLKLTPPTRYEWDNILQENETA